MKKFAIYGICSLVSIASLGSSLNLKNELTNNNFNDVPSYYLKIVFNNQTNINANSKYVCFYLDISMNGRIYNDNDFLNIVSAKNIRGLLGVNDLDLFLTNSNSSSTILNLDISNWDLINLDFTFGTFYDTGFLGIWCHAQLIAANNYQYDFRKDVNKNGNIGTQLVINAYGNDTNSAQWSIANY